jgi:IMP dehydrogenase
MFSDKLNKAPEGYTFDDFLLVPSISNVEPKTWTLKAEFPEITLLRPIVSSAMDTVTEAEMALQWHRRWFRSYPS